MFESVLCAQKAKAALNGADIYAGCCTLKIEYARVNIIFQHFAKEIFMLWIYNLNLLSFNLNSQLV